MGLLDKLKRKRPGAKNPVFVEAGRRGGIKSGQVRRARAEQRRLLEEGSPPTELAEKVAALLKKPRKPSSMESIEAENSLTSVELAPSEEKGGEGGTHEDLALSSLERALDEAESEVSRLRKACEMKESELLDMRRLLPSPQHIEKAMDELEYVKYLFEIPYTLSILEKLSNIGAGKVKTPEESEKCVEASKEEAMRVDEEVDRILRELL